jgi:DNA-binding transcriptional ArsR family regulator
MAVAKEYLFDDDDVTIGTFGKAIGHAARSNIIHALLEDEVLSYNDIRSITPLSKSTVNFHLRILENCQLLQRATMANNLAGYSLDRAKYVSFLHAMSRRIKPRPRYRQLARREVGEVGEVDDGV